jgi:hypothetical protein
VSYKTDILNLAVKKVDSNPIKRKEKKNRTELSNSDEQKTKKSNFYKSGNPEI